MKVSLQKKPQQVPQPIEVSPDDKQFMSSYFREPGPISSARFVQGQYVEAPTGDEHIEHTQISTFTTVAIPMPTDTQSIESRLFQSLVENNSQVLTEQSPYKSPNKQSTKIKRSRKENAATSMSVSQRVNSNKGTPQYDKRKRFA